MHKYDIRIGILFLSVFLIQLLSKEASSFLRLKITFSEVFLPDISNIFILFRIILQGTLIIHLERKNHLTYYNSYHILKTDNYYAKKMKVSINISK